MWRALVCYSFYDGPVVFTAEDEHGGVYLFRATDVTSQIRTYWSDSPQHFEGEVFAVNEDEIDWRYMQR